MSARAVGAVAIGWISAILLYVVIGYLIQWTFGYLTACRLMSGIVGIGISALLGGAVSVAAMSNWPDKRARKT